MNLILSAAAGYTWDQLKIFIISLRRVFDQKVVLILNKPDSNLVNNLKDFNIDFLDTDIVPKDSYETRYGYYQDYLSKNKFFDQVLLTDSRDVFFQNNPFSYNYKKNLNLFLEDRNIKESSINMKWIKRTVGKSILEKIQHRPIVCSGIIIGKFNDILEYCHEMKKNIIKYKYKPSFHSRLFNRKNRGWDQGIHNYLVYGDVLKYEKIDFFNNSNGNVANLATNKELNFNSNGKLINKSSIEYSIIHQYDRFKNSFIKLIYDSF